MDFQLDETQEMVRETARRIGREILAPRAKDLDHSHAFPAEQVKALAEAGLLGVNVPAEYGGAEAGVVAYSLAISEVAGACASTSVTMGVTNMVGELICHFGTEAQKSAHVPKLTSGAYPAGAFALSEPQAGSDAGGLKTRAERRGDRWVLNGAKQWITSGDVAGVMVVWARTGGPGPKGISAFLVEGGTPGLVAGPPEKKMGQRGSPTVGLTFEDCEIPEDALLGREGEGFKIAMMALDGGRIGIASQAVGIAQAALDAAVAYAAEREAFGSPIGKFQAIQWKIADMATEIEAARLLALQAAALKEAGRPFTQQASMAKLFASEMAVRACLEAVQIHGGYGYVDEFPVERYLRDVRVTTIYEGTSEIQRLVIARNLLSA
jgi:alkylation response protein AidB-like acyl-CoA dehydrogenase